MPKGKILPPGGIAIIPPLPDCASEACELWLFRNRRKGTPEPTETKKIEYRSRVNEAVKLYIGTIMKDSAITQTEQTDIIDKVSVAANQLLLAMKSKKENKAKECRKKLAARTDYNTLGNHTWVKLNILLRLKSGDIRTLALYPIISGAEPVSRVYLTSVKILAKMQPDKASSSSFRDPPLLRFIAELGGVWKEATGLTPTPKNERWKVDNGKPQRDDNNKKFYPFAEWVWAIISSVNLGLEENYQTCLQRMRERGQTKMLGVPAPERSVKRWQIKIPKEGSILDIVRHLSKKGKSGTPHDNG